ncbi:MAG TPA: hypothetical protein VFE59_44560 [Trebonia sp.]|nr:hypothetical protein [Trebonia sp.]
MTELEQLSAAQWSTGMMPHIVFRAGQGARYFPRARVVGLRRRHPGGPRAPSADDRDLPAAGARAGGAADLAADAAPLRPEIRARIQALFPRLVELLGEYRYDDEHIRRHYAFQIKDVFFSAVLVAANAALLDLAGVAGGGDGDRAEVAGWLDRGCAGRCCRARAPPSRRSSRTTTGGVRSGRSSTGCCGSH